MTKITFFFLTFFSRYDRARTIIILPYCLDPSVRFHHDATMHLSLLCLQGACKIPLLPLLLDCLHACAFRVCVWVPEPYVLQYSTYVSPSYTAHKKLEPCRIAPWPCSPNLTEMRVSPSLPVQGARGVQKREFSELNNGASKATVPGDGEFLAGAPLSQPARGFCCLEF